MYSHPQTQQHQHQQHEYQQHDQYMEASPGDVQPQHQVIYEHDLNAAVPTHTQEQPQCMEYVEPALTQPQAPAAVHLLPNSSIECIPQATQPPQGSCSSSVTAAASGTPTDQPSRNSSTFGSIFQQKRRKSSEVVGWNSEDDEEMDRAVTRPARSDSTAVNEKSPWLRRENRKQKQVRTCLCMAVVFCFLVLGSVLGYAFKDEIFSKIRGQPSPAPSHQDPVIDTLMTSEGIEATYHVNKTIVQDSDLRKIFYGIDYTPRGSQEPGCKVNLGSVIEDIKVLSQLTDRIRLYGMACQQAEAVLKAIEYLELTEMQVILTLWVDHNSASWEKQSKIFWNLIDHDLNLGGTTASSAHRHGAKVRGQITISKVASRISGVSVGNEVLFRNEDQSQPNGHVPLSVLTGYIDEIRHGLAQRAAAAASSSDPSVYTLGQQLSQIPVFSSDLGRNAGQIVNQVDVIMSNIHPFFAYTAVSDAADWAFKNYYNETVPAAAGKPAVISEVGWPSGPSSANLGPAVPSMESLQTFVNTWVCQANKKNIPYYYFEAFDEPWKNSINARESQWGIMTVDRKLKVSLPKC